MDEDILEILQEYSAQKQRQNSCPNIKYIASIRGDEGFKVGVGRVIYKDWGIKRAGEEVLSIGRVFQQKEFGSISLEIKGIL